MCIQQDLFDVTMVTIIIDKKSSESESFIEGMIEGFINILMEFHHFKINMRNFYPFFVKCQGVLKSISLDL